MPRWQRWRLPLLLAVLGHVSIGLVVVQQKWQRPLSPAEPARAIEAYFYQPAPVITTAERTAPLAEVKQEEEPEEPTVVLESPEEAMASANGHLETQAGVSAAADGGLESSLEFVDGSQLPVIERGGSLMERALQQLQSTDDMASAHRAEQIQRYAQPKITVEKRYQEVYDGSKPIRNSRGCLSGDPSRDGFGFDGLMAAEYIPCGDEMSAGQQLQEILQRRSKHLGRSK